MDTDGDYQTRFNTILQNTEYHVENTYCAVQKFLENISQVLPRDKSLLKRRVSKKYVSCNRWMKIGMGNCWKTLKGLNKRVDMNTPKL